MKREALTYRIWSLLGLVALMVLTGCSKDEQPQQQSTTFEAQAYVTQYNETALARAWEGMTRAWTPPSPYVLYSSIKSMFVNQKDLSTESIGVFFTKDNEEPFPGNFFPRGDIWQLSNKDNKEISSDNYYLYGFIPKEAAESATIAPNDSYSNGAVLTINGLSTVSQTDVCVIIGAKEGSNSETVTGLQAGSFLTHLNPSSGGNHNYIFLLFDHLYSALRFRFKIDSEYAALRTIKIRKLELIAYSDDSGGGVRAKYNATITLKSNDSGASPIVDNVTFTPDPTSAETVSRIPLYEWDGVENTPEDTDNEVILNPSTPTQFMGSFVPGENVYFKLFTTYDVCDRKGTLIRESCEAENVIDLRDKFNDEDRAVMRGHSFSYTILVRPTYAYVLSNNDIDNPELKISE